ncbi:MAG: hypothetical protein LH615_16600, partial [Ferruginibacter sp.]|nr:hypothetical protein [Ferruginibacter sp.]
KRTIYLECKAGIKLNIVKGCYNNFTLIPIEVKPIENKIVVGVKPATGLPITLKAKRGYIFWILTLEPKCKDEKFFGKFLQYISIKAIAGLKSFNYLLKAEKEMVTPEMQ